MCSNIGSLFHQANHVQSPIKINANDRKVITFESFLKLDNYWNLNDSLILTNNGSTIKVRLESSKLENIPNVSNAFLDFNKYYLDHFHFHWSEDDCNGTEHIFDNLKYGMEVHFVHYNEKYKSFTEAANHPDGLAVIAIFCVVNFNESDRSNYYIESEKPFDFSYLQCAIRDLKTPHSNVTLNATKCLPLFEKVLKQSAYSIYKGSLTTAPFTENVIWILMEMPVNIPKHLIDLFRDLISINNTPIRNNVRSLQHSNPEIFYDSRNFTNNN